MSDPRQSRFARRLRLLRERHNWTQEASAERLEVSVATINRWEHAKSYPRAEQRSRIVELLGAEGEALFVEEVIPLANSSLTPASADSRDALDKHAGAPIPHLDDSPFWNVHPVRETPLADPALKQGKHPVSRYFERSCFVSAREALRAAVTQGSGGIALFGPPMVGKTRLAREALLQEAPEYLLLPWPRHDFALSALNRCADQGVALLLDDVHELGNQQEAGRIHEAVRRLLTLTPRLLVIITSRSGADEAITRQHYDGLIESLGLAVLRLAPMARDGAEARSFIAFVHELACREPARPIAAESFDGTPGSVLLGLERRTMQLHSPRFPSAAKAILKALALLRAAEVYDYPESRVRRVAEGVFELPAQRWSDALDYLVGGGWVSLDEGDLRGESKLYVPSDAYLDICLPQSGVYPRSNRRVTSDFPKVCEALAQAPADAAALIALSRAIFFARREVAAKWNALGLTAAQTALAGLDPVCEPQLWARGQLALGLSYSHRWQGDPTENATRAISALEAAQSVLTRDGYPTEWALIQWTLASLYYERLIEPEDELFERAIERLCVILEVYTREAYPYNWGRTHNSLGVCFTGRERGDRAANIEQALSHLTLAAQTLTRQAYPAGWTLVMRNLGEAYSRRECGDRAENERLAESYCEAVLDDEMREMLPYDWARTHVVLGDITRKRRTGEPAANLHSATAHYETALAVLVPGEHDLDRAKTLTTLDAAREALAQLVDSAGAVVVGLPLLPDDPGAPDCS